MSGLEEGTVRVWDAETEMILCVFEGHGDGIQSVVVRWGEPPCCFSIMEREISGIQSEV